MAKITPRGPGEHRDQIVAKTSSKKDLDAPTDWWNSNSKREMGEKLLSTVALLKEQNAWRMRQATIFARMYGNRPLAGFAGANLNRMTTGPQLPMDRPTMSVITSCLDTLVSRITQSRPRPVFLTDNGDYRQRNLAKQLNQFIAGEFYQTKAYEMGPLMLRDSGVIGTGVTKVLEDQNKRVAIERRLATEVLVDPNDSVYGKPRQIYELKLIDRMELASANPKYRSDIEKAQQAYVDQSSEGTKTVSDQVMVGEGWRLPSGPDAGDGLHAIVCTEGIIFEEEWSKDRFPFAMLQYSEPLTGFWGMGLAEFLMGTQVEINKLLMTISQSINLVGVPRVFVEDGSKVVKAHLNNQIGAIVTYRGTKPEYEVAPCVPAELYQQLQRLVDYAYQQSGVSSLSASSQKPAGLSSGTALREYDDLQSDRFAALNRRYDNFFIDLAYLVIDKAKDIAERDGKYQTIYPNKDGTKEIDLPDCKLLQDPFVIQCYDSSSLPRDPAGRLQKVTEMMQAGLVSPQEGRRLLNFPDIEQEDRLANAPEERILQQLDLIIEKSEFNPPDAFTDLAKAEEKSSQYINLYSSAKLEEEKMQMLRDYFSQVQDMKAQAMQPQGPTPTGSPGQPPGSPMANPMPLPQSDLMNNVQ